MPDRTGCPESFRKVLSAATALALLLPVKIGAQDLQRATIAPGGEISSGGTFEITALAGQPLAGRAAGGEFVLEVGGLFPRSDAVGSLIFTDGFETVAVRRDGETVEGSE